MKQSLQLRIGQSLTMTPQLQQAIKLLQLSSLELQTEIQETLETNPLLEQDDSLGEINVAEQETPKENGADIDEITELRSSAETIAENRAEQTLPDEFEVDTGWDEIYDTLPAMVGQQANNSN
ncbi:MAG: RNA polymerase factor sigma-54, partial [Gammaproteobacteria bacterium]|nr:RNA polymerase factor sigma-54 [Gammaproteobacteria bacterium]